LSTPEQEAQAKKKEKLEKTDRNDYFSPFYAA
jgi:hypothetical protein